MTVTFSHCINKQPKVDIKTFRDQLLRLWHVLRYFLLICWISPLHISFSQILRDTLNSLRAHDILKLWNRRNRRMYVVSTTSVFTLNPDLLYMPLLCHKLRNYLLTATWGNRLSLSTWISVFDQHDQGLRLSLKPLYWSRTGGEGDCSHPWRTPI